VVRDAGCEDMSFGRGGILLKHQGAAGGYGGGNLDGGIRQPDVQFGIPLQARIERKLAGVCRV
jgi:hypothetical protein